MGGQQLTGEQRCQGQPIIITSWQVRVEGDGSGGHSLIREWEEEEEEGGAATIWTV